MDRRVFLGGGCVALANGVRAAPTTGDMDFLPLKDPVHIRDFHATVLHLLGFDHARFTYRYQGLDQRLTGVEPAKVVRALLA